MNILIIGPPGSGKGVQSDLIKKKFGTLNISIGDLLRKEVANNTDIGIKIKDKIKNGVLIEDELIFAVLNKSFKKYENILLDGFPRTLNQARYLYNLDFKFDYVIKLNVSDFILLKRIKYRLINNYSSSSYNILYNKTKIKHKDNDTGSALFTRVDDKYDIFKYRLNKYNLEITLILNYFLEQNVKLIEVDAEKSCFTVFDKIKSEVNKYEKCV